MPDAELPISDASVNFTVKELIGRVDSKLDQLISMVDQKASKVVVDELEKDLADLKREVATAKAVATNTRWLLFSAVPTAVGLTSAASAFLR